MPSKEQVVVVKAAIYIMLASIEASAPNEVRGKSGRKNISRQFKKDLMILSNELGIIKYNNLVKDIDHVIHEISEEQVKRFGSEGNFVNPFILLNFLKFKYNKIYSTLNIKETHFENIKKGFQDTGLSFITISFVNKLIQKFGIDSVEVGIDGN